MTYPTPFIIHPSLGSQHTHTVILLHGRGSTAEEFATDLFALATTEPTHGLRDAFPSFRWVFPDAGERWCTSFKEKRSAWFDTYSLSDLGLRQDLQVEGLRSGIQWLKNIIESEVDRLGGNSENIVLGGFSQGSATALWSLFTGLSATKGKLGAFIGLSAWAPFLPEVEEVVQDRDTSLSSTDRARTLMSTAMNVLGLDAVTDAEKKDHCLQSLPIYLGHGNDDVLINVSYCHRLSIVFEQLGSRVDTRLYTGADREGHWIKEPDQTSDIIRFLKEYVDSGK